MKDLALRSPVSLAVALNATTPVPPTGQRPIIWSTTTSSYLGWNGSNWVAIAGAGGASVETDIYSVDYIIDSRMAALVYSAGNLNLSDTLMFPSPIVFATGQTVYLNNGVDLEGVYTLGSVASLSAVPITRHADWPSSKPLKAGMIIRANFAPDCGVQPVVSGQFGVGVLPFLDANTTDNSIGTYDTGGQWWVRTGMLVRFTSSGGTLPAPLSYGVWYKVIDVQIGTPADTRRLVLSSNGVDPIDLTTTGAVSGSFPFYIASVDSVAPMLEAHCQAVFLQSLPVDPDSGKMKWLLWGTDVSQLELSQYESTLGHPDGFAIGNMSRAAQGSVAIGDGTNAKLHSVHIGVTDRESLGNWDQNGLLGSCGISSVVIGYLASSFDGGVSVGAGARGGSNTVAVGSGAFADYAGSAIGYNSTYKQSLNAFDVLGWVVGDGASIGGVSRGGFSSGFNLIDQGHLAPSHVQCTLLSGDFIVGGSRSMVFVKRALGVGSTSTGVTGVLEFSEGPTFFNMRGVTVVFSGSIQVRDELGEWATLQVDGAFSQSISGTSVNPSLKWRITAKTPTMKVSGLSVALTVSTADYGAGLTMIPVFTLTQDTATDPWGWFADLEFFSSDESAYFEYGLDTAKSLHWLPTDSITVTTSEALTAGNMVNLHSSSGAKCRKADANPAYSADGFVLADYASGAEATVYISGENPLLTGLTVGPLYLSATAGGVTSTPPGAGNLVQRVGFALSATKMVFQRETPIQT